jgi:hypothetical protein
MPIRIQRRVGGVRVEGEGALGLRVATPPGARRRKRRRRRRKNTPRTEPVRAQMVQSTPRETRRRRRIGDDGKIPRKPIGEGPGEGIPI